MARKPLKDEPVPTIKSYFVKAAHKAGSGNKAAAALRMSQGNFSRLMAYGAPGDDLVIRLAEYLGEDPEKLLLLSHAEYAPEKAQPVWARLLKKYTPPAAAAVLLMAYVAASGATPLPSLGDAVSLVERSNVYYVKLLLVSLSLLIFSPPPADRLCIQGVREGKHVPS